MVGGPHALIQQDYLDNSQLREHFNEDQPCHIYMVCRRPRITIAPTDVRFTDSTFQGSVTVQQGATVQQEPFSVRWPEAAGFTFDSQYPFNTFSISEPNGKVYLDGKTALLAAKLGDQFVKHLSAEVLYVGQAYGEDGSRTAPDRLRNHSTLQQIYAEAIARTPEKEIWLVLWSFRPILLASFDGTQAEYGTSTEEDDQHIDKTLATEITEQQRINFTEAAVIRYFQPEYNTVFKGSFPNPAHKTYSECYDLDINSIAVELDTEGSYCKLWSATVAPRWTHFIHYPLHSKNERQAMFDFELKK